MKTGTRVGLLSAVLALALSLGGACKKAGGVPIELSLGFEGTGPRTFTTVSGWDVELTEARAMIGPLYAYAPSDAMARWPLGASRAFAHGGHSPLEGRLVRAELLEPRVVDALDANPVTRVGGFAGAVDALSLVLGPAEEGPTRGHDVWVRGIARRDGEEVPFEGGLALDDPRLRQVDGIAVEAGPLSEGARLIVGVDASAWLREADFTGLEGELTEGSQPHRALYLGARSAASWSARIETGENDE